MTELIEEFKHFCNQEQDTILVHPKEMFDWINQNYISKQQILNLECLKDEEPDEFDDFIGTDRIETKNKLRKEIKDEITKDLFKDFKQVSNPLDEDYE